MVACGVHDPIEQRRRDLQGRVDQCGVGRLGRIVLPLSECAGVTPKRVDRHERLGERQQRDAVFRRPFDGGDDAVHGALGVQGGGSELGDACA